MTDDLRRRYAEALAAKFTYPVYRCDKDGENEWVENPEPADRVEQTPYIMVSAGDGNRSFWTPTCTELAEVVAAVRDEELETVRRDLAEANVTLTELAPAKDRSDEDRLRKERNEWRERAEKAEAALAQLHTYAIHRRGCAADGAGQACTCGLAALDTPEPR